MKALVSYLAIAALIVASSFTVGQQKQLNKQTIDGCFGRINVHRSGKAVVEVTWTVNSADISQFVVEHSYDDDYYETVGTQQFNGTSSYKVKDNGVYPGFIYYRITAIKTDGSTERSTTEKVRIAQHY